MGELGGEWWQIFDSRGRKLFKDPQDKSWREYPKLKSLGLSASLDEE